MPTSNTWSATGYPGSAGVKTAQAQGRERSWNNTPNFGSLPKDEKPVNGYSDTQWKTSQEVYSIWYTVPPSGSVTYMYNDFNYENGFLGAWMANAAWDSEIDSMLNTAIVKALVKMADAKINLPVVYAEASKTSNLILDTARRVDRAYRAFRRGDLRGIATNLNITPRRLHKSWLEYKYGWMPLLMDVKGAAEFFAQQHVIRPPRFTVRAVENVTKTQTTAGSTTFVGIPGTVHPYSHFMSGNFRVQVKVWCELSSPHLSEMQQLGLTNPLLVAWELIPFSFVFDWFISVGDWLVGLTAQQGVTVRRKMFSIVDARGGTWSRPGNSNVPNGPWLVSDVAQNATFSKRRYTRSIPDLSPFSLYPPVTNSFGFTKLVTSLALIQGTYRGAGRNARL